MDVSLIDFLPHILFEVLYRCSSLLSVDYAFRCYSMDIKTTQCQVSLPVGRNAC